MNEITLASIETELEEQCNVFVEEVMVEIRNATLAGETSIPSLCPDNGWSSFADNPLQLHCVASLLRKKGLIVRPDNMVVSYANGYNVSWTFPFLAEKDCFLQ